MLHQKQGAMYVRLILPQWIEVSNPSVSRAMSIFKNDGYIVVESSGNIVFNRKGNKKPTKFTNATYILQSFAKTLGISEELAARDACRIEHIISQETFERIKEKCRSVKKFHPRYLNDIG